MDGASVRFEFHPLRMTSSAEESTLKDARLNRAIQAFQAGLMPVETTIEQLNAEQVFPVELKPEEAEDRQQIESEQDFEASPENA